MPVEIIDASGKLLQIKIRGMLKKADYDRIIQIAKEAIAREGKVRALAMLEGFEGWERARGLGRRDLHDGGRPTDRKWLSSAMKNGATTRWRLPPKDFVPPPSSSFRRHA